ncbi:hypothetical protein Micbo1qcDRAFT_162022, partial [Microdochium bolleyi]
MDQLEALRRHCRGWRHLRDRRELDDTLIALASAPLPVESYTVVTFFASLLTVCAVGPLFTTFYLAML